MNKNALNQMIARVVIGNKIVSRDIVQSCAPQVTADRDLGQVLVARGYLTQQQYSQIHAYIAKNQAGGATGARAPAPSSTAQGADPPTRPVEPRSPKPSSSADSLEQRTIGFKKLKTRMTRRVETELPDSFRDTRKPIKIETTASPGKSDRMDEILVHARTVKASDVHLSPFNPLILRQFGRLTPVSQDLFSDEDIQKVVIPILTQAQLEELQKTGDLETAYAIPGYGRYRITVSEQRFGWDFTARVIDRDVRSFEASMLPESCKSLIHWAQGLVLVTGPLGCGKTSTLSTLVELVNQDRDEHIITIENPIEVIYKAKKCQITQREVGQHTLSPANALRGALRQDPDILVVSELRDLETIRLAVSAAETGHLVFGTMNTNSASRTIDRLIDSFPPEEQDIIRGMISESLRGVISQQLVPRKDGQGIVPAYEILMVTQAVSNMIRKQNIHQIESAMVSGRAQGMVLLDNSLRDLVGQGVIEGEEAFFRASNPKNFKEFAPPGLKGVFDA